MPLQWIAFYKVVKALTKISIYNYERTFPTQMIVIWKKLHSFLHITINNHHKNNLHSWNYHIYSQHHMNNSHFWNFLDHQNYNYSLTLSLYKVKKITPRKKWTLIRDCTTKWRRTPLYLLKEKHKAAWQKQ